MIEPDLIKHQRKILQAFRQANAQREQAEADAEAQRKLDLAAANTTLNQARRNAGEQVANAHSIIETAKALLSTVMLQDLISQTSPAKSTSLLSTDTAPEREISQCVAVAKRNKEKIETRVAAILLETQNKKRKSDK